MVSRTRRASIPGVYTATETVPAGWSLTDITCSGDTIAPNSSDTGNTATFNAQSGETITCVFTNTKHASSDGREGDRSGV